VTDIDPDRLAHALQLIRGSGNVTMTVNAGGVGVWIACTAAAVCLVATLFLGGIVWYLARVVDDHRHQLNAVYMMAPQLRPEPKD
jgi:hypothetical protein